MSTIRNENEDGIDDQEAVDYISVLQSQKGCGFDFSNTMRNARILKNNSLKFQAKKTGTTICGIVLEKHNVVILGADTRATAGDIIADKCADKLHPIASNIQCAGAGTSADLTATTEMIERNMEIHRLNTNEQVRVATVVKRLSKYLFQYQGYIGCHLVLGGVDITGPSLYQIHAHGSTDRLPFTAMGSGSLCAMSVLESRYSEDMTVEQGKELVADAIGSGTKNDLASGGNIDLCIISAGGEKKHLIGYRTPNDRLYKAQYPKFTKGTTPLLDNPVFKRHNIVIEVGDTLDRDGDVVM